MNIKYIDFVYVKIRPTLNNTFVTLTDKKGNVLLEKHAGLLTKFRGKKKKLYFLIAELIEILLAKILELDYKVAWFIIQFIRLRVRRAKNSVNKHVVKPFKKKKIRNVIFFFRKRSVAHNGVRTTRRRRR